MFELIVFCGQFNGLVINKDIYIVIPYSICPIWEESDMIRWSEHWVASSTKTNS